MVTIQIKCAYVKMNNLIHQVAGTTVFKKKKVAATTLPDGQALQLESGTCILERRVAASSVPTKLLSPHVT